MNYMVDYLIVGAGPAGLQLGYCLEKAGRDYLILESGDSAGTFFKKFPRHRKLISINKVSTGFDDLNKNLRWDWNSLLDDNEEILFKHYSKSYFPAANDLVLYLKDFADRHRLKIKFNARVANISKPGNFHILDHDGNTYTCRYLFIATGLAKSRIPQVPGIELAEDYSDVSTDPENFRDQRVMVVGKGNSAFETADNLVETTTVIHLISPNPVRMAWKTHFVGHLRAVNNNILDTYQLKSQNTILDAEIERIEPKDGQLNVAIRYNHAEGQRLQILVDRVITCTGFRFDDTIFDRSCRPELVINDKLPAMTSEWESTNVKDMYFLGTLMQMRDYHRTFSAFIHGFRYNVVALSHMLAKKYHSTAWPSRPVKTTPEEFFSILMRRIHTNSDLFQQPGFFCDLIVVDTNSGEANYFEGLPLDYIVDTELGGTDYYTLTMEYGSEEHADPFNIKRDPEQGILSHFIHPVIRHFVGGSQTAEYHIPEDLENNWYQELYVEPFQKFLYRELCVAEEIS